jgi:hypothetical protein
MSVVHSPYFPGDAGDIAERSTINLKPFLGNAQSSSGPLGMLDASLFKVGQSTEKPNHAGGFEVDMNLPFPIKLHYILSQPNLHDCITWLPHGRAWKVTNQKVFEAKVIPRFFRSDKMASFMRQVNGWAFNRITEGTDVNAYYHEVSFLPALLIPESVDIVIVTNKTSCFQRCFFVESQICPLL